MRRSADGRGIRADEEALLATALQSVHELNERCLVLLQRLAAEQRDDRSVFLARLGPELRGLSPSSITAAAQQPFLLIDFAFGQPRAFGEMLDRERATLWFPSPRGLLPPTEASALARGALLLAQSVCRHHQAHAGLLLGLDPSLVESINHLRLPELEALAEHNPHHIRIRWEDRPEVWRLLLSVPHSPDPDMPSLFHMYGMQLLAGDLILPERGRG